MNGQHPDSEQLSAHLDGQPMAGVVRHLEGCADCRSALADLRAVAAAIGTAVPPPPAALLDTAVAAALAEFDGLSLAAGGGAGGGEDATIAPLRQAGPVSEPSAARRPATTARRRPPLAWMGAAAAAIALMAVIPLLMRGGGSGDDVAFEATDQSVPAAGEPGRGALRATESADDLGDHSDPVALAAAVAARLSGASPPVAAAASGSDPSSGVAEDAASGPGQVTGPSSEPAAPPCEPEARAIGENRLGPLLLVDSARWKGTPAVVVVFALRQPAPGGADHQLYVMARTGCALLAEQRF